MKDGIKTLPPLGGKLDGGFQLFAITLVVSVFLSSALVRAASSGGIPESKVPPGAQGFRGTVHGQVVSIDDTGATFVLEVEKIVRVLRGNEAKNPKSLDGLSVRIYPRVVQSEAGALKLDDRQTQFVRDLRVGTRLKVDLKSDGLFRLRMIDIPEKNPPRGAGSRPPQSIPRQIMSGAPAFSISKLSKYLSLQPDQEKKMETIETEYRRESKRKESAIRDGFLAFVEIFDSEPIRLETVDAKFIEISGLQADLRFDQIRKLREAEKILDAGQFNKYKKLVVDAFIR